MKRMQMLGLFTACALAPDAALAGSVGNESLLGTWRVTSALQRTVGVAGEQFHEKEGYLIFTPEHRMVALIGDPGRKPANNDAEALALSRSLVSYTGKFELAPDHYTLIIEFSSTQLNLKEPQVRYYNIDGDKLTITAATHASVLGGGRQVSTIMSAVRER